MKKSSIVTISLFEGKARALLMDSTAMAEAARQTHGATPVATAALGRLISITSMMGAMMKDPLDKLSVTIRGDGPAGALVAAASSSGDVKAYMDNPLADVPNRPEPGHEHGKLDVAGIVGKDGYVRVIKDLGLKEPYTGQVHLTSGEIGEDMALYFTASEQIPSLVSVGVLVLPEEGVLSAGGIIVQPLPGCPDIVLSVLEAVAPRFSAISAQIGQSQSLEALAGELFEGMPWELIGKHEPRYVCDCSQERLNKVMVTLGREELVEMIDEGKDVEVKCHFCNRAYVFTPEVLSTLLAEASEG